MRGKKSIRDPLIGAKGITYLMFLFRDVNQAEVGKTLRKSNIVKNENVVRTYVHQLHRDGFLTDGEILKGSPGPQKKRSVKTLRPIFAASFLRAWKILAGKDERQFTNKEKDQMSSLFKSVASFLDYFPNYFFWGAKSLRKNIRAMQWHDTLKLFFQFCEGLVEACWEIKHYELQLNKDYLRRYRIIDDKKTDSYLVAFEHLSKGPYRYVYDAYNRKRITDQHILDLADFSKKGHKDIYLRGTILQELHLLSIALSDPFFVSTFFQNIEDIEAILWEDKLRVINIRALDTAIGDIASEENMKISRTITKMREEELKVKDLAKRIAMHEATDQFRREAYSYEESDVNEALRMVIKIANLDMTEEELKGALISFRVCQALEMYINSHCKDFELKLKDGRVLKLGWEKSS